MFVFSFFSRVFKVSPHLTKAQAAQRGKETHHASNELADFVAKESLPSYIAVDLEHYLRQSKHDAADLFPCNQCFGPSRQCFATHGHSGPYQQGIHPQHQGQMASRVHLVLPAPAMVLHPLRGHGPRHKQAHCIAVQVRQGQHSVGNCPWHSPHVPVQAL